MSGHADDASGIEYGDEAPALEVVVYRHGEVVHRELVESEEAAADVVDAWSEQEGVECTVDDLSVRHRAGDILEPEPSELPDDAYRHDTGAAEA